MRHRAARMCAVWMLVALTGACSGRTDRTGGPGQAGGPDETAGDVPALGLDAEVSGEEPIEYADVSPPRDLTADGAAPDAPDAGVLQGDGLNAMGCRNLFRVGMVLLDREDARATTDDVARVGSLMPPFSARFEWATKGLARVDFAKQVVVLTTPETGPDMVAVARTVITSLGDNFEFLFVFDTFTDSGPSTFTPVRIDTAGTGQELLDFSMDYGSRGVLLGITRLRSIRLFDLSSQDSTEMHLNAMLHEMMHCWSSYLDYLDPNGARSPDLRNPVSGWIHWSKFIVAGTPASVMGGLLWLPEGPGTWRASWEPREGLIPLDLYVMGLITTDQVPPVELIVTETPPEEVNPGSVVHGTTKTVSIEQVVAANGPVRCLVGQEIPPVGPP